MQLGMIGLGRMGFNMAERIVLQRHEVVAYTHKAAVVKDLASQGAVPATSIADLVAKLDRPRHIWMMVPAAGVDALVAEVAPLLAADDVLIDGGNSHYHDDIRRSRDLAKRGIHYLDVGTSGGVWGKERGYCLMIGGDEVPVGRLASVFGALAPGVDAAPRTAGRSGQALPAEQGYLHCGPSGAGHFVKMVHNGIEYGIMAAYAEGFDLLRHANAGKQARTEDAETAPLRHPDLYQFDLNLPDIAEVWRRGSVVASWLLDLTAKALLKSPNLEDFTGRVSDSGEGRWTIKAAVDVSVPVPVLSSALYDRFSSRGEAAYADKLLSAMRQEFGGHQEKPVH